ASYLCRVYHCYVPISMAISEGYLVPYIKHKAEFPHMKHMANPYHSEPNSYALLTGGIALLLMTHSGSVAQPANPSFDCRRAQELDERIICSDGRLAELDQAVAIAYAQASKDPNSKQEARETAKET